MAQMTGFLKRVYRTYKCCQLEDVNSKTDVNSVHFQGQHLGFRHVRRYMATCKSRFSHVRLEHIRLLPGQRLITFPKLIIVDSRGEFQKRYFYAVSPFIPHGATAHGHVHSRHLRPTLLHCRPWAAPRLSRTSSAGSSRREPHRSSG